MAGSPIWKVYSAEGEYVASVKYLEDAAALIVAHGDGATIRHGHARRDQALWVEGNEEIPASESYDRVAATVTERYQARIKALGW